MQTPERPGDTGAGFPHSMLVVFANADSQTNLQLLGRGRRSRGVPCPAGILEATLGGLVGFRKALDPHAQDTQRWRGFSTVLRL